jgi:N-methylhydantoinase B
VVYRRALRRDSGGAGTHRGGLDLEVEVEGLVEGQRTLADTGRHHFPPWGVLGGSAGLPSDSPARLPGEQDCSHVDFIRHAVPKGTTAVVVTAGGGGWGDPLARDPKKVAADVVEDYVSIDAARDHSGVVFRPGTFDVDLEATARRRADIVRRRGTPEA